MTGFSSRANQWTSFCMIGTSVMNELNLRKISKLGGNIDLYPVSLAAIRL